MASDILVCSVHSVSSVCYLLHKHRTFVRPIASWHKLRRTLSERCNRPAGWDKEPLLSLQVVNHIRITGRRTEDRVDDTDGQSVLSIILDFISLSIFQCLDLLCCVNILNVFPIRRYWVYICCWKHFSSYSPQEKYLILILFWIYSSFNMIFEVIRSNKVFK